MQAIEGKKFIKQSEITIRANIYGQSCKVEVWKVYRNTGETLVYIHSYLKLIPSVGMNELVLNNVSYLQFWMINLWVNLMLNFGVSGTVVSQRLTHFQYLRKSENVSIFGRKNFWSKNRCFWGLDPQWTLSFMVLRPYKHISMLVPYFRCYWEV